MGFFSNLFGSKGTQSKLTIDKNSTDDIESLRRTCWLPVLKEGDGELTASKFSGIPFLPAGELWPECPNCGNPIQLFVQLNSNELPDESGKPWGDGLLQFFYCTNVEPLCDVDCMAWGPFAKSSVLRVVPFGHATSRYTETPVIEPFPPKLIEGWTPINDLPNWEEREMLGIVLSDAESDELGETYPRAGEKLLGWPYWVQSIEYPNCPECGLVMKHVFQIDSDGALPYMFGDVGVGHITQCPEHPATLAFGWACS